MAFPKFTSAQILYCIKFHKMKRGKKKYRLTGWPDLDSIRERAFERNLSMADLDYLAGTKRYFQTAQWSSGNRPIAAHVAKAVEVLEGHLLIKWRD